MRKSYLFSIASFWILTACTSKYPELQTTLPVAIYSMPSNPETLGNVKIGELSANVSIRAKGEVLAKDTLAYKIEFKTSSGQISSGFVLMGSRGLTIHD